MFSFSVTLTFEPSASLIISNYLTITQVAAARRRQHKCQKCLHTIGHSGAPSDT